MGPLDLLIIPSQPRVATDKNRDPHTHMPDFGIREGIRDKCQVAAQSAGLPAPKRHGHTNAHDKEPRRALTFDVARPQVKWLCLAPDISLTLALVSAASFRNLVVTFWAAALTAAPLACSSAMICEQHL